MQKHAARPVAWGCTLLGAPGIAFAIALAGCGATKLKGTDARTGTVAPPGAAASQGASPTTPAADGPGSENALPANGPVTITCDARTKLGPIFQQDCASCHTGSAGFAGIDVTSDTFWTANLTTAVTAILTHAMPPTGIPAADLAAVQACVAAPATASSTAVNLCTSANTDAISDTPLRRLTSAQIVNTLTDVFGTSVVGSASAQVAALPTDGGTAASATGYANYPSAISDAHVAAFNGLAEQVATAAVADATFMGTYASCVTALASGATPPAACVDSVIRALGFKLFRRPVEDAEAAALAQLFTQGASPVDGVWVVTAAMLQSSSFLYQVEVRGDATAVGGRFALTPFELATRLAFALRGTTPDAQLLAAAASASLGSDAGLAAQVSRLLGDAKTQSNFGDFYLDWLQLRSQATPTYSAAMLAGLTNTANLPVAARNEFLAFVDYVTFTKADGTFGDLLTSPAGFVTDATLADIYGVSASTTEADLPADKYAGVMTRALFTMLPSDQRIPPKRGSRIRKRVLCDTLAPPPANASSVAAQTVLTPLMTTRQWYEQITSPAECIGCHVQINPLAFALETYDTVGRFGMTECRVDAQGKLDCSLAINATVNPAIDTIADGGDATGPVQLSADIAAAPKAQLCYARNLFAFLTERNADDTADGCLLQSSADTVKGDTIQHTIAGIVSTLKYYQAAGATAVGAVPVPPTIAAVAAGGLQTAAATISWTTSTRATSQVSFGTSANLGSSTALAGNSGIVDYETAHTVQLAGLQGKTKYYFSVTSVDAYGDATTAPTQSFTTP